MRQEIVYNNRPSSVNNKNDVSKAIYQKALKKAAKEQNAFMMEGDLAVQIVWKQHLPADIDNMIKHTLDALKGICYADDRTIVDLKISKRYAQKEQVIITIKHKFILSKFIRKIAYIVFARPIMRFINANFKDIIDDEKFNHNLAIEANCTNLTLNPPADLAQDPPNTNKNKVANSKTNPPSNPPTNLATEPKPASKDEPQPTQLENLTPNPPQLKVNSEKKPNSATKSAQPKKQSTPAPKVQDTEKQAIEIIKATLKEFKDQITIAYKFSSKNLTIYILVSKFLEIQTRKDITHASKEKLTILQEKLNQGKFTIHYGSIPLKSKELKL